MKKLSAIIMSSLLFYACSDSKGTEGHRHEAKQEGHQHTFRCPMHPEVTGKEGDTCPKCGMKLEHSDDPVATGAAYYMQVAIHPTTVEPNKEVTLAFTPKIKGKENDAVALDIEHEKKIHLILVNEDLTWFDHIHPEYTADGSYTVTEKFPAPGKYTAFADYKPTGASHVVDKVAIDVKGNAPAQRSHAAEKLSGTSAAYSFELKPANGKLVTGALMRIAGIVKKDGREIDANSLDNYLGAKAHFVMVSTSDKEYLHVHPNVANGKFDLHTTFSKPGLYRGWVQFNAEGQLHTIDFTMKVQEGSEADKQAALKRHENADDHSGHSH